jgi:distribution and morphology protein 34
MAFNFNWSPLMADTSRAREMLTAALNKYPKPPIIVDDIIVTELNLGETPPDLEILEIGDLAEDRFRGIFKMSYTGDAFLTLKTRVQANPLNTYLSTKPSFTSPQPLAAASGLTIPLQITLSDIRLSGFVILVFSKQKGLTLVFRNDPLESLKVSSTFDSIPFVRDYLQREIEKQLRNLFMEDLPAILHKLSLRLWSPEYRELDDRLMEAADDTTIPVDPLASPPQDPVDWLGVPYDESQVPAYSLDAGGEYHASFSQKNLLRLAALTESHRTLALFTPPIRDAVFRAWAGASERGVSGFQTPIHTAPTMSRMSSYLGSVASTSSVRSETGSDSSARPTLSTSTSYTFHGTTSSRAGGYGHRQRKAKKRVINLRRPAPTSEAVLSDSGTETSTPEPSVAPSSAPSVIYEDQQDDLITPPRTPDKQHFRRRASSLDDIDATPRASIVLPNNRARNALPEEDERIPHPTPPAYTLPEPVVIHESKSRTRARPPPISSKTSVPLASTSSVAPSLLRTLSTDKIAFGQMSPSAYSPSEGSSGGILEQAWMNKIAREIARKVKEEQEKDERHRVMSAQGGQKRRELDDERSLDGMSEAPPAYAA